MNLLKKILEQNLIAKFRVPSKSEKGKFHIVRMFKNRELECDCIAGQFRQECSHIRKVKEKLSKD